MNSGNTFTSINVEPDNPRKFTRLCQTVASDIQKISQNVSSLKRMVNLIGTAQDSHDLRQQLQRIQQTTQQLVKDANSRLSTLNGIPIGSEERQLRMQKERLTDEYTSVLNMFQATQREELKKQSRQVQLKRSIVHSNSSSIAPPPSSDPFRDDLHANQLIELQDDKSKTLQYDYQMENERDNLQQLAEQEEAIRNLERDINDVNEIYKNLGRLVHEQGETIDSIEANIENAFTSVRQATSELGKASNYMTQARKKKCILIAVLIFIIIFIFLIYKLT